MPISLSFGKKKASSSTTAATDKTTSTDSTQSQTGLQSQTQTNRGVTSGQTQSQGASTTDQQQLSTTQQQQRQAQTQTGQLLRDNVLNPLEATVQDLLGRAGGSGISGGMRADLESFDVQGFVDGIMTQARSRSEGQRREQIALTENAIGGGQGSNSAAALLAGRINRDANESLAAQESQALAAGMDVLRGNSDALLRADANTNQLLASLLDSLRGSVSTSTAEGTTDTTATSEGRNLGSTRTAEQGNQMQQNASTSQTDVLNQLVTLLRGTEKERANSTSNTRESSGGFGLGIG